MCPCQDRLAKLRPVHPKDSMDTKSCQSVRESHLAGMDLRLAHEIYGLFNMASFHLCTLASRSQGGGGARTALSGHIHSVLVLNVRPMCLLESWRERWRKQIRPQLSSSVE